MDGVRHGVGLSGFEDKKGRGDVFSYYSVYRLRAA
jgi:hypothetical protein